MSVTIAREGLASPGDLRQLRPRRAELSAKKQMRVGIFTDSYPPVVNGVTTSVMTLIDQLERMGHRVFVFAPRFPGHSGDPPNVVRFPSVLTPFDRGYPLSVPISPHQMREAAGFDLDIIHSQSPFMLGLIAMMIARHEHKPLVATNHTLYTEYSHYVPVVPEEITKEVTRHVVRWYYERCDAVIAPSNMAAKRLCDGYGIRRTIVKVVPTGIPLHEKASDALKRAVRARYQVPAGADMLLYAGRIAKEKNLGMLLDSFEHNVVPKHPQAFLVLAGSGVDAESIQERIDHSAILRTRARLTGFLHREELDPLYAAADLFVFPSITETQGVVLGEALAAGTPCCAVDAAGSPETVTHNEDGLLTANDPAEFGAAVNSLLDDPELRRRMGEAARELAGERTPEQMVQRVVTVYRAAQKRVNMRRNGRRLSIPPVTASMIRKRMFLPE
jgi:1,2-diacylglycerol 3-alpha-glucosyltransferase